MAVSAIFTVAVLLATSFAVGVPPETAADVATRRLLDALDQREMPDMTLAVLDRISRDKGASAELIRELPFRRSAALVAISRREADGGKRAALLDEAQAALDAFLASGTPHDSQAIRAYTQKGTLLVERGRGKVEQAERPGADVQALRAEALRFFEDGIAALKGTVKPDGPVTEVRNAEDAVIKALRDVNARIDAAKGEGNAEDKAAAGAAEKDKPRPSKPKRLTSRQRQEQARRLKALAAEQETLQAKLIQTRILVADAVFQKATAYEPQSKDWKSTVEESTALYQAIADKYPTMGGGLLARCHQGRNDALLGRWKQAVDVLAPVTALDATSPLTVALRAKAVNTTLECLLAEKDYEAFEEADREFAMADVSRLRGGRLDADWLGLKYRAAAILDARAAGLDEKDQRTKDERNRLQAAARKLATEVARANADFASEARSLAAKLGKVVAESDQTFAMAMQTAKQSLALMQASLAEAKTAGDDEAKERAARQAAKEAETNAIRGLREALALAGAADPLTATPELPVDVSVDDLNEARYLLAYLLYESRDYEQSAAVGQFLAERYPNAKGSRQAARIALAAWQQLAQRSSGAERDEARRGAVEVAGVIMRTWPNEAEAADAAAVAIASASAARDADAIAGLMGSLPPESPRRSEVLLRGGSALWREVQQTRRLDAADRPADTAITAWKETARRALDEGLAGLSGMASLPPAPLGTLAATGAISRGQIALDDGDSAAARGLLEQPVYGPWTLTGGSQPALTSGSLAEAALTLSLLVFIQTDDFTRAEQAMKKLEDVAGQGEEASSKLTAMYLTMGRDLQDQLESLADEAAKGSGESLDRARKILQGFTTFLDAVASRDPKTSSQIWVATTYRSLGSGKGTGAIVPKADADGYLRQAAAAFGKLLAKQSDPDVVRFEASIRLQLATIYRQLNSWDEAREQLDWMLADAQRRNSLEVQVMAAEVLQGAAQAAATASQASEANRLFQEAVSGNPGSQIWGWAAIANRLERQGINGSEERTIVARSTFFEARLHLAEGLLDRARLPDATAAEKQKRLGTAATIISMTHKLYPDLGGDAFSKRFARLLETIQREQGTTAPTGFSPTKPAPS